MKIEINQIWISENHPHENFKIYDIINDISLIYCWKRIDDQSFENFIASVKGKNYKNTFPYSLYGECRINGIKQKIKKYDMKLCV